MPWHPAVTAAYRRTIRFHSGLSAIAVLLLGGPAMAQAPGLGLGAELVDPHVLRVCADPNDLPFSNQAQNRVRKRHRRRAGARLGKKLGFTWQPQVFGFLQLTLDDYRCDVVMGITQGNHEVENSNAYYRSAYALIFRPHSGFDGMQSLEDERLQGKRIGIVAGTPPATILAENGLLDHVHAYQLSVNSAVFRAGVGHDRGSGE